jgi:hypothetical protein
LVISQLSLRNQPFEETLAKIKALPIASLAPKVINQLEQLGENLMDFTASKGFSGIAPAICYL